MEFNDFTAQREQIEKQSVEEQKRFYEKIVKNKYDKTEVRIHASFYYGQLFYQEGNFRKTIEIIEPIVVDYQSYPYTSKLLSCFNLMGVATHCEAEYNVSRFFYETALKIAMQKSETYYYAFEYNNIALTYIEEGKYEEALHYLGHAQEVLPECDEDMGAYIYINTSIAFQKKKCLQEALKAFETAVIQYHARQVIPDDVARCAATLYYRLGEKEKYGQYKKQILQKLHVMHAAEFMDACKELFSCALDDADEKLMLHILQLMNQYMKEHPQEINVGLAFAELKYSYAEKKADTEAVLEALKTENDYKNQIIAHAKDSRVKTIQRYMEIHAEIMELELDALTGFKNRKAYYKDIAAIEHNETMRKRSVGVVFADVNGLKKINDSKGHEAGDELIAAVAEKIREAFPKASWYRFGGDEFLLLSFDKKEAVFRQKLKTLAGIWDESCSASIGSVWLEQATDIEKNVSLADKMMYRDKSQYYETKANDRRARTHIDSEESLKKIEAVAEFLPGGFFVYYADEKEQLITYNQELLKIYECQTEEEFLELTGNSFKGMVHPEDLHFVEEDISDQISQEKDIDCVQYRIVCKDQSVKTVLDCGRFVHTELYGDVYYVFLNVLHAGQSQQWTNQLLQQKRDLELTQSRTDDYYKNLMDTVNCGIISYTAAEHRLLHMNKEALRICGARDLAEAQENMCEIWRNVIYPNPDTLVRLKKICDRQESIDYECTIRNPKGHATNVLARSEAFYSPQGECCVVTTFLDISESLILKEEKHLLEQALLASERKNDVIGAVCGLYWQVLSVNLQTDTYKTVFINGRFTFDDPGCEGVAYETFRQKVDKFADDTSKEQLLRFLDQSTLADRLAETNTISMEYLSKTGIWVSVCYAAQKRDARGKVTDVLFLMRRIDEQKRKELEYQKELEETAREARRANEAKTNFLRRMSHDIRTPLNGIIGLLKIDEQHFEDQELVKDNHKKMEISANHLLSLINDVLQTSKLEDGNAQLTHEVIKLTELTQDIVSIIIGRAVEAGITWDYEKGKAHIPYPYIYGSPVHLRQIFLNIYGNCIKYNRPGGKITTVVDTLPEHDGVCTYRWIISDTGIGMSQEFLKHIFDPFAQASTDARSTYQGIGLGMFIVKGLIDQMGGTIKVTSQEGVGSTFEIILPFEVAPAPEEQVEEEQMCESSSIEGLHLLLAEDNVLNAEIAEMLLRDEGAVITVVSDGKQAVDLFTSSCPGTFDAILMDIMMPVMDGLTAAKEIRKMDREDAKHIPIIAMTANAFKEDAEQCLEAGMDAHLAKPLDMDEVVPVIARFCTK